jgi:hypothetical protein
MALRRFPFGHEPMPSRAADPVDESAAPESDVEPRSEPIRNATRPIDDERRCAAVLPFRAPAKTARHLTAQRLTLGALAMSLDVPPPPRRASLALTLAALAMNLVIWSAVVWCLATRPTTTSPSVHTMEGGRG